MKLLPAHARLLWPALLLILAGGSLATAPAPRKQPLSPPASRPPLAGPAAGWTYSAADTWAFRPAKGYAVPRRGLPAAQIQTPVDAFVLQKLKQKGLKPAPPADRRTLIRRATFDLTGLPPTPEETAAFRADPLPTPKAFDKVIERLLASPRYGERWGRHWLDVVRYADTGGGSNDFERPNAWRYRDYVIRSFNADKPYDRFVLEQIAGDELDPDDPECLIATGFLRMGPWEHTAMSVEAVTRQQWLDDVTHGTATAFLGLTAGCARCHDHKSDPISAKDYYRLQAVFASTSFEEKPAPFLASESRAGFPEEAARYRQKRERTQARLDALMEERKQREKQEEAGSAQPAGAPRPLRVRSVTDMAAMIELDRAYKKRLQVFEGALGRYEPRAYCVGGARADETFLLLGGQLTSPSDKVTPGVLTAVHGADRISIPVAPAGRRLALARWIASPQNPLTARVMANRIWQYHFGRGLVETSNNFGKMGKRPTHPELLDWLARYFVEHGWSVKAVHRLLLRSAAYQRSGRHPDPQRAGKLDPEDRLLSRFPPRRLEAEELRDSILAVAGELNLEMGGPGTFPEINPDLARQPRLIMGSIAPAWEPSPRRAQRNRRTIYTYQQRSMINPLVDVFNGANPNDSCERREASTVAPQVFSLFNSRFSHDMALAFARRLETRVKDGEPARRVAAQVDLAFRRAFQRPPTPAERAGALRHVEAMTRHHRSATPAPEPPAKPLVRRLVGELSGAPFDLEEETDLQSYEPDLHPSQVGPETRALAELCLVLLNTNEFIYID